MDIKPLLAAIIADLNNFNENTNIESIGACLTILKAHLEDDSVTVTEDDLSVLGEHGRKAALLGFVTLSLQALEPK